MRLLDKASAASPAFAPAHYELALLLDKKGRAEEAISQYEATVQAEWAYPEAHFRLGEIALAADELEKAEMHFLIVTDLEPANRKAKAKLKTIATKDEAATKKPK